MSGSTLAASGQRDNLVGFLVLGAVSSFYVPTSSGRVYPTELFLIMLTPYLLISGRLNRSCRKYFGLGVLWFVGQVASDIYNHVALQNSVLQCANIAFFVIDVVVLLAVKPSNRQLGTLVIALGLGVLLASIFEPSNDQDLSPWKFTYALFGTCLVFVLLQVIRLERPILSALLCLSWSALNLLFDYRSLAVLSLITAIYIVLERRTVHGRRFIMTRAPILVTLGAIGLAVLYEIYARLAATGDLGLSAAGKYSYQSEGSFGILVAARKEIVGLVFGIKDDPWLGSGSRGALSSSAYDKMISFLSDHHYTILQQDYVYLSSVPYPAHSVLFGEWFLGGMAAAIFWTVCLSAAVKTVLHSVDRSYGPGVFFGGIFLIDSILVSPLGAQVRFVYALLLVICVGQVGTLHAGDVGSAHEPLRLARTGEKA